MASKFSSCDTGKGSKDVSSTQGTGKDGTSVKIAAMAHNPHDYDFEKSGNTRRRFFGYFNLFVAAMLTLVLGNNYVMLYLGWEGVGLASYLLIAFWFNRPAAVTAGKKAFIMNRVGDAGLVLAIFLIFAKLGTVSYTEVFKGVGGLSSLSPPVLIRLARLTTARCEKYSRTQEYPFTSLAPQICSRRCTVINFQRPIP